MGDPYLPLQEFRVFQDNSPSHSTKRSRPAPSPGQEDRRNRTDELLRRIRFVKAQAMRPSAEMNLMRKAAIDNHPAFESCQIRDPSAREALERLFSRHQNIILETSIPSYHDLSRRRAPEPHFHATLLGAALLAPVLCPFYRKRSCLDFLQPDGISRARGDRNFSDASNREQDLRCHPSGKNTIHHTLDIEHSGPIGDLLTSPPNWGNYGGP